MKRKFFAVVLIFCALIALTTGALFYAETVSADGDAKSEQLLALNEIEQLAIKGDLKAIREKAALLSETLRADELRTRKNIIYLGAFFVLLSGAEFLYLYCMVLKPFEKLESFSESIASGNFDVPLEYERTNYFGAFTWAFDSMRNEITKARGGEKEAIENNKTIIATLSHDIKTPIASIKAYAEGLEANMDNTFEKRQRYISVIMAKCDEVSKLTDDLFTHSLSDLDKLNIAPEKTELGKFFEAVLKEIGAEKNDILYQKPEYCVWVSADKRRLTQVAENLVNNARKYAGTDISISVGKNDGNAEIHFRDFGKGIPDEDMPFVFGKFYRGRNCGEEQGSGLGLYIVKYIAERSEGKVLLHNFPDGLEVVVRLPLINTNPF